MAIDEAAFLKLAEDTLERFATVLEDACGEAAEVDYEGGILRIELDSGGEYVINKHAPNRQIWLSSPKSGAWHFDWDADRHAWLSTRPPTVGLNDILEREFQDILKKPVGF